MMRVWLVDDAIPYDKLEPNLGKAEPEALRHLLTEHEKSWVEDPQVLSLCKTLSEMDNCEVVALQSPQAFTKVLNSGALPPHVVIFDWQGSGFSPEQNVEAIAGALNSTFAYVQVYTNSSITSVDDHLTQIRAAANASRLLPVRNKHGVTAAEIFSEVGKAFSGTMAGEIADVARARVRQSLESALVELCSVEKGSLGALSGGKADLFLSLLASRLRDGLAESGTDFLEEALQTSGTVESTQTLQRFLSIWHYFFPTDNHVRQGDIVRTDSAHYLVLTAPCDLERFNSKTAGYLTLAPLLSLSAQTAKDLKEQCKVSLKTIGGSPIAGHQEFGQAFVVLSNVPLHAGKRTELTDYLVRCHALTSIQALTKIPKEPLRYSDLGGYSRICTLSESVASQIVSHLLATLARPGIADFPAFEKTRLQGLIGQ